MPSPHTQLALLTLVLPQINVGADGRQVLTAQQVKVSLHLADQAVIA
jgi:hypothetical protein